MLTILAGLSSALSYAGSDLFSQQVTRKTRALTQVVWVLLIGSVIVVPVALLVEGLPDNGGQWRAAGMAMAAGAAYVAAFSCLLRGLQLGDLGLVATLNSLQGAFAVLAFVALGQPVTLWLGLALAMCAFGAVLTSMHDRASTTRGAGWGLAAGFLFAAVMIFYSQAGDISWLSQAAFSRTTSLSIALPLALLTGTIVVPRGLRLTAGGAGALELCGLLLLTISLSLGPVTVAGVTTTQFGTFAVLLGFALLGERPRFHQWLGIACTIAGVTALALFA
jgi:drug/metabolite transporter (DMT)-like permease